MTVLVAYASKHDATAEIAEAIGSTLTDRGLEAIVSAVEQVEDLDGADAVVLGSAVYMGKWLEAARDFVDVQATELAGRPVWLFSSGPIGDPPRPAAEDAVNVEEIVERTQAREHRVFAGRLERARLGFAARAVMTAFRAAEGDFRDWDEIAVWAESIAASVQEAAGTQRITSGLPGM